MIISWLSRVVAMLLVVVMMLVLFRSNFLFVFKRRIFIHDIIGASLIIIFAVYQSLLVNQEASSSGQSSSNSEKQESKNKDDKNEKQPTDKSAISKSPARKDGDAEKATGQDERADVNMVEAQGDRAASAEDTVPLLIKE